MSSKQLARTGVSALVGELTASKLNGRTQTEFDRLGHIRKIAEHGGIPTLEPFLPLCLTLRGKPYNLSNHFPFSPIFKTNMPATIVLKTGRQVSKCLVESDAPTIWLADGRIIGSNAVRPGDMVLSLGADYRRNVRRVLAVYDTGFKQAFKIVTRLGAEVLHTADHRVRTLNGYTAVRDLQPGSRIAGVRLGGVFNARKTAVTDHRIIFTAYMLGDGCHGLSGNFGITSECDHVVQEFLEIAAAYDCKADVRRKPEGNAVSVSLSLADSVLRQWLHADGSWKKYAWEKVIPEWVYKLSKPQTRLFLSRLWATDGMVKGPRSITYTSTSQTLARGVRSLLAKFGIPTSISETETGYRNNVGEFVRCRNAWVVRVETRDGLRMFMSQFDVPGKPVFDLPVTKENNNRDTIPIDVQVILDKAYQRQRGTRPTHSLLQAGLRAQLKYPPTREKLRSYVAYLQKYHSDNTATHQLTNLLREDVIWDEVVSITPIGLQKTCDFEVEEDHNFVCDGIYTHNSTSLASHGVLLSNCIPDFRTLHVTPRYEQIRRFSNNYVRPFIERSPIKSLWSGTTTENSVLQRSFKNHSVMLFSFALLDADRIRGVSTDKLALDEVQDMDPDHFPIMRECMSHSDYGLTQFAGTPKSLDNPLEGLWQKSSQAEWHIPCYSCGKWNIPSREFHVDKMIGPVHEGISENCPGTICYKCRRPVFPRHGRWVHRFPDRRARMTGYHVPQIIMPLHYGRPDKWGELCAKRDGWANTSQAVFCNEVLGESVDAGQRLISETELRAAATLPWTNKPDDPDPEMLKRLPFYKQRVLAVDWGGGGEDGVSFTALALLGLTPSNEIHVLWGKRLVLSQEHLREAVEIKHWMNRFSCDLLVHDYTGAGIVRETVLVQAGLPLEKVMPVQYVRAAAANLIKYVPASVLHNRDHYRLDKTRSLLYAFQAIKTKLVKTFKYDYISSENAGLMSDFLALVEDKRESRLSSDIYTITRNPLLTDDFAQAVNIGCSAIWHSNSCWPDFAAAANIARITIAQEMDAGSANYGWESGPTNFFQRGY